MEQLHMQMQSFLVQCLLFIHVYVLYIQSAIVIVPYPLGIYSVSMVSLIQVYGVLQTHRRTVYW